MMSGRIATLLAIFEMVFGSACAAQTWTSIGPAPLVGGTGPTGGIKAIAVDPADANHWLLGAASGGVWASHDAGGSWNPITDSQPNLNIGSVAFAASDPRVIYAGV
jgi:hypothetical protein